MKKQKKSLLGFALAGLLLFPACSLLTFDSDNDAFRGFALQTDQFSYEAELKQDAYPHVEVSIPMTYTNVTDQTVYLLGCYHPSRPVLMKQEEEQWVTAYAAIELMCLSPPWVIRPREVFRDTLHVYGILPGHNAGPTFDTEIDGTYRLERTVYMDPEGNKLLPDSLRISNLFTLRQK